MEILYTSTRRELKGLNDTIVHQKYLFDRTTGDVTMVVTEDCEEPFGKKAGYKDVEIGRNVLRPQEIPPVVKKRIKELLENHGSLSE